MRITLFVMVLSLAIGTAAGESETDVLGRIRGEVGFTRADLGYHPAGYWNRFPLDVPYRLTSFDALFAEPLKLYDYATTMGNAVELYLDPTYADTASDGLYQLVYNLGVDRKLGGFRSYSANLRPAPAGEEPLVDAVEGLYARAGRATEFYTFGNRAESPDMTAEIRQKTARLPDSVQVVLAGLIVNLTDAIRWRATALRNCDVADLEAALAIRDLASTQGDGMVYYPELDDIAAAIDLPSMHYAALKTAAAAESAERALRRFARAVPDDFTAELPTPFGTIALFSSVARSERMAPPRLFGELRASLPQWTEYDATNTLLVVDFGRRMIYQGTPGAAASLGNPVSVVIDLGGDDYYGRERAQYPPAAGVGLCGVGLVIDSEGDDRYEGSTYAQGAGLFGVGVLLDRAGNDEYRAELSSQGAGYFGIGLCLDGVGDDTYYLCGDGQGMGGVGGGVGVCASFGGDDRYTAEPLAEKYNRGDYHSQNKINGNNAQGAGFGRRGDGSDGHAWAGGLGALIDINGDDRYYSGNWTLGIGYWFATGIAYDKRGDDLYESCYFTQGSGAHYCNGILIDEGGNDRHELYETAGAGLGFGWDFTNALLVNKGGNDVYRAKMISMGLAQIRSNAFLIDIGGDDAYYLGQGTPGLGEATFREGYDRPGRLTTYYAYASSFGGFIDIGGRDRYVSFTDSGETTHPWAADDTLWFRPARTDSLFGHNNYGVGVDAEAGAVPELEKWK
ncbi:MAG: hypothetical protein PHE72_02215 [candidate division Zixibacteria bacterium]|nr:hypothetical protein [candidate division Zixibacteria bacterium]